MMDDEDRKDVDDQKRNNLLILALKQAKSGSKFISGSTLRKERNIIKKRPSILTKKRAPIITEVPKLEDIKDIDPDANWSGRDWLYEIALISQVNKIIDIMNGVNAPSGLITALGNLLEAMKNGDTEETRKKLNTLTENWGASTSTTDRQNYHLLRAVIRLIYSTYPLE